MGVVRTSSLNPIVIKGNLLYDSITKERFYIKGVAYDPIPNCLYDAGTSHAVDIDILADDYPENESVEGQEWVNWRADLTDIARMNVNAIRIYTTNPDKSHSKFMNYAESLGLYVVVPLTGSSFGRLDAQQGSPSCYTGELGRNLLYFGRSVMKEYSFYHNTLMFAAGNELYLWSQNAQSFPCLKSFVRDLHTWQTGCGASMRRVPLVYAMQDIGSPAREYIGEYLTSMKESEDDVLDIFGINSYIYCQGFWPWDSNSPLYQLNEVYKNYAAPFVVTEFGCQVNGVDSRTFNDAEQMMTEMQETVSGGFVYEYSQHVKAWDARGFGLVETMASTCTDNAATAWYQNAYALQDKYSLTVSQSHGNHVGTWTDEDQCVWKPPSTLEHTRPDFPDWTKMSSDISWAYSNWNDALPPMPQEDPVVACPDYELSNKELKINECYGSKNISMHSSAPSHTPSSLPTLIPSKEPTFIPSKEPTHNPTDDPTMEPTRTSEPISTATAAPTQSQVISIQRSTSPAGSSSSADGSSANSTSSMFSSASSPVYIAVLSSLLVVSLLFYWFCLLQGQKWTIGRSRSKRMTGVYQFFLRRGFVVPSFRRDSHSASTSSASIGSSKQADCTDEQMPQTVLSEAPAPTNAAEEPAGDDRAESLTWSIGGSVDHVRDSFYV